MSTVKKGVLTASGERAKHLRPWHKREFWKVERKAAELDARKQGRADPSGA